jgi:hypothetical protein
MKNFEPASGLSSRYPRFATLTRGLLAVAVAGLFVATLVTAGPGNYAGLRQASGPPRPHAVYVTLPTVVVIGRREQALPVRIASSGAGSYAAEDPGWIGVDPGSNRVNLTQ